MLLHWTSTLTYLKKISVEDFVREKRRFLEVNYVAGNEPFVLVHGDFNGRNIMMQGTKVVAVLDWEFPGAYSLSELVGVDILEVVGEGKLEVE
jgi:aminoglycoside phosphotransferase (APT) family kinase protein